MLAFYTDPAAVGIYSAVLLAYTAVQAVSDSAIRQLLPLAVQSAPGFLRSYRLLVSVFAPAALITILIAVAVIGKAPVALLLAPIAVAPVATAWGVRAVGYLQLQGEWRTLASGQLVGAIAAASISMPLLVLTHSLGAAAVQVLAPAPVNSVWCRRRAHKVSLVSVTPLDEAGIRSMFVPMVMYSGLAWGQGQLDRVLLGVAAGAAALGSFSMASALARSIGDPLAASTANILRSSLASLQDARGRPSEVRRIATRVAHRALGLATVSALAAAVAGEIARHFLNSDWDSALRMVPILALSVFPAALNWSGSVLQVVVGDPRRALLAPISGLLFAPVIAFAAASAGLSAAAWLVVLRECLVLTTAFVLVRSYAPWRAYVTCLATTALLGGLVLVLRASGFLN